MSEAAAKVAHAVLAANLKVRKGEAVVIETWSHTLPEARAFAEETRRLGARPIVLYEDEEAWWTAVGENRTAILGELSDAERALLAGADVYIYFWGPEDRPRLHDLPDAVQERVTGWNEEWYRLARKSGLRGCRMSVAQATDQEARRFGLDGPSWRTRLLDAGAVDARRMETKGKEIVRRLARGSRLTVRHPNGTDLTIALEGVHARADVGVVDAAARARAYGMMTNSPSGQVLVAVDRSAAEGTLVTNRPVYLGDDRYGEISWRFKSGRLVEHSIGTGREQFEPAYAAAPKGRDLLGYLSIGLNPLARELPPCEDTEEGAILVGIGRNTNAGGKIRVPFQGYALLGEATIEIDGRPIATDGHLA